MKRWAFVLKPQWLAVAIVVGAFAYIDAEVTKGDRTIPSGSRILGVAKHSGSLLSVYEFQEGVLRGSDVGAAYTYVGDRSGQSGQAAGQLRCR